MNSIQKQRLLNVARALRESPNPEQFDTCADTHTAGVMGHYAARSDLQDTFALGDDGSLLLVADGLPIAYGVYTDEHFGLGVHDSMHLFEEDGCGRAKTNTQAARFVEEFVLRKSLDDAEVD